MKKIDPSAKGKTAPRPGVRKLPAIGSRPGAQKPSIGSPGPKLTPGRQNLPRLGDLPNPADRKPAPKKPAIPNKSPKSKAINKPAFNKEAAKRFALAAFKSKRSK
jgi:hypothetical protein